MIEPQSDINMGENIQEPGLEPFSITHLLKLCEDQNSLVAEMDNQIGRFIAQLAGYEQELYEKDVYIEKLEDELKQKMKIFRGEEVI